ncbi:ribonuclease H [Kocuria palustris]|uniref:ribonuclease H family protein n=1 Tax=Kocuria palustris TaxID=71999 RepID=UPI0011A00F62|nr:ribonuclease H [Kocuria palustris]
MTITAAADGSALGNPGPAGWAWYIDDSNWRSGGWPHGTNNMGELQAVLDLLEATADLGEPLRVLCDSQYVINSITKWMKGWKKKGWKKGDGRPVLNVELMKALDAAMKGRDVSFEWVKGHAGHDLNEAADARANAAAKAFQAGRQPEEGPGLALARAEDPRARLEAASDEAAAVALPDARDEQAEQPADSPAVSPSAAAVSPSGEARPAPGAGEDQREDLGDPDPDLLSALDRQSEDLAAGPSIAQEVHALERRRLTEGLVPADLHPEAILVGADGRPEEPESLQDGDASADLHLVGLLPLGRNAVQLTVHVVGGWGSSVHSSLWTREDSRNELGQWQLRHHQVTLES